MIGRHNPEDVSTAIKKNVLVYCIDPASYKHASFPPPHSAVAYILSNEGRCEFLWPALLTTKLILVRSLIGEYFPRLVIVVN